MTQRGAARAFTATIVGTHAVPVSVEVDVGGGLPAFIVVGLGDAAILESRDRVRSALKAAGFSFPSARVVVNLAPAPLRKHGTGFDLPIAAGILAATGQIPSTVVECHLVGELSLDGGLRPVPGVLAHALAARRQGHRLVLASDALPAVSAVGELDAVGLDHLAQLREVPRATARPVPRVANQPAASDGPDLSEVAGHDAAKRALEIAAAGDHNVLMVGPPGSGKTMLARRLGPLLPPLTSAQRLEAAVIHDVAGLDPRPLLGGVRPCRAPHHSSSLAGLVGGGTPLRPGEISLAHTGVLFLDELPEFGPSALQALRQPIEDGHITLVRADGRVRFPARFTLVGAANPCPCGYHGDPQRTCTCAASTVARYQARIGGPLMDRIDMRLRVDRVPPSLIVDAPTAESSSKVRARVLAARDFAERRGQTSCVPLSGRELLEACRLTANASERLNVLALRLHLSGRSITRLLRVARTIADLTCHEAVDVPAIEEAIAYRGAMS